MNPLRDAIQPLSRELPEIQQSKSKWGIIRTIQNTYYQISWLFTSENTKMLKIGEQFLKSMDQLEQTKVAQEKSGEMNTWTSTAEKVSNIFINSHSKKLQELGHTIKLRGIGARYRSDELQKSDHYDPDLYSQLETIAKAWKEENKKLNEKTLNDQEKSTLQEVCKYPEYTNALLGSKETQGDLFKFVIQSKNTGTESIDSFIQFRGTLKWLGSFITKRTKGTFKVVQNGEGIKDLQLPFEGTYRSILDSKATINMHHGYQPKLEEIITIFKGKNSQAGNVEFFAPQGRGFTNFNSEKLTYFDGTDEQKIDLSQQEWWKQIPIAEEFSLDEIKKHFNKDADGKKWVISIRANRETLNKKSFEKSHAFLTIFIPKEDGSGFKGYNFGMFPKHYPESISKQVGFIGNTVPAYITLDQSIFYDHRQFTNFSLCVSEESGKHGMSLIGNEIQRSYDNTLPYQMLSKTCVHFAQDTFNAILQKDGQETRNLLYSKPKKFEPNDPLFGTLKKVVLLAPERVQPKLLKAVLFLFAPWRKFNDISLTNSDAWKNDLSKLPLPARLFYSQEKEVKGTRNPDKPSKAFMGLEKPRFLTEIS
ncbi:MAG: hypothetical protein Tsb0021_17290 [Chlamydiales bacterium]